MWRRGLLSLVLTLLCVLGAATLPEYCGFERDYPPQYVSYKTRTPIKVDGVLDDPQWEEVEWTDYFVDISTTVVPRFKTRAKIRWDNDYIYVAGWMEETQVWANNTKHDSVIFSDNDFEVFMDPNGSNFYYKEFEMNAINTTWSLCLDKPYLNGGYENSSRVFGKHGWDDPDLLSATYVDGGINNPAIPDRYWTTEVAFPISAMIYNQSGVSNPPKNGTYWRINFSRVEWHVRVVDGHYEKVPGLPCDNWVWAPTGVIDIHLPEKWGYVQFSDSAVDTTAAVKDPDWTIRHIAMEVYYAELAFHNEYKAYTSNMALLEPFAREPHVFDGSCASVPKVAVNTNSSTYTAFIRNVDGTREASIRYDRLLLVRDV